MIILKKRCNPGAGKNYHKLHFIRSVVVINKLDAQSSLLIL